MSIPDHPMIANCERYGYPDGPEPPAPVCPECGAEVEILYKRIADGEILGCPNCIKTIEPYEG